MYPIHPGKRNLWKAAPLLGLLGACPVSAASWVLAPIDDAFVYSSAAATNYGSDPSLASGRLVSGNTLHLWSSFLKFDLSAIPDSLTITGATLHMYQVNGAGFIRTTGTDATHVADDSWSEATLNWGNQPDAGVLLGSNPNTANHRGWSQWDLFATGLWDANADQADDVLSLVVIEPPGSSSHNWCSKESGLLDCLAPGEAGPAEDLRRPYLEITAVPLPTAVWLFGSSMVSLLSLVRRRKP